MVILIQCSSLSAVSLYLHLSPTRAGARAVVFDKSFIPPVSGGIPGRKQLPLLTDETTLGSHRYAPAIA
ncbi:hypothetical protein Y032_0526g2958 [Ancylostoma ceylanicum]|uniref:Uncharacterized protein n=1 Tax=Ancylostoma ceylanicum TaxID=53326 RepID=A0A016WSN6_9BILA|nr:hypothetical protein Y032_0526g2958 [Ancylostoma ceylanicum]